jgi:hypothetical protein
LDTGIFGTQFFFEVLSENGMHDLAYEAMNKREEPELRALARTGLDHYPRTMEHKKVRTITPCSVADWCGITANSPE